jgi:hypothetical protein
VRARRPFACICLESIAGQRDEDRGGHRTGELCSYGLLDFYHLVIGLARSGSAAWRPISPEVTVGPAKCVLFHTFL